MEDRKRCEACEAYAKQFQGNEFMLFTNGGFLVFSGSLGSISFGSTMGGARFFLAFCIAYGLLLLY